jgi:signal peptidase I
MAKDKDKDGVAQPPGAQKGIIRDNLELACFGILLITFLKTFVAQNFTIPSASMRNTMMIGDHLMVNKFIFAVPQWDWESKLFPMRQIERGDIIVFRYPMERNHDYVKRCVALPGDTVEFRNKRMYINEKLVTGLWEHHVLETISTNRAAEPVHGPWPADRHAGHAEPRSSIWPYTDPIVQRTNQQGMEPMMSLSGSFRDNLGPVSVPAGHVMAIGDNRDNSLDSRYWGFLPADHMRGRPFIVWWSYREKGTDYEGALVPNGPVELLKNYWDGARNFFRWTRWDRTGHMPK